MDSLIVANRLVPSKISRIKISDVDLSRPVGELRSRIAGILNCAENDMELIYCGESLKNHSSLESYGIKNMQTIHVIRRRVHEQRAKIQRGAMGAVEVQQLVFALRTAIRHPSFRTTIHRLSRPEILENVITATPGLAEDPVAVAFLQDCELLKELADPVNISKVIEAHPALVEALQQVAAAVHEETDIDSCSNAARTHHYSYSLDALSDDDEMDLNGSASSSQEDVPANAVPANAVSGPVIPNLPDAANNGGGHGMYLGLGNRLRFESYYDPEAFATHARAYAERFNLITSAQLASALAVVSGQSDTPPVATSTPNATADLGSEGVPSTPQTPGSGAISLDAFTQAMQQVLGPAATQNTQLQAQLQQMRDLGIADDALSTRALEVVGGNVQAAVDLIFSQMFDDNVGGN